MPGYAACLAVGSLAVAGLAVGGLAGCAYTPERELAGLTSVIEAAAHVVTASQDTATPGAALRVRWHQHDYPARLSRIDTKADVAVLELDVDAHEWLARSHLLQSRYEDFLSESKSAATLRRQPRRLEQLAAADRLKAGGRELSPLTEDAEREWRNGKGSATLPAIYCALAGERATAITWLETALATQDHGIYEALNHPVFGDYASEPSYQRMIARLR